MVFDGNSAIHEMTMTRPRERTDRSDRRERRSSQRFAVAALIAEGSPRPLSKSRSSPRADAGCRRSYNWMSCSVNERETFQKETAD